MTQTATHLDDIAAEIGFSATATFVAWYGGTDVWVPEEVSELHPIAKVIGVKPLERLCAMYGGSCLYVPDALTHERARRDRMVVEGVQQGQGSKLIAQRTGLSERRVQQLRQKLEADGLLPMVLHGSAVESKVEPVNASA